MRQHQQTTPPPWSEWLQQLQTPFQGLTPDWLTRVTEGGDFRVFSDKLQQDPHWRATLERWAEQAVQTLHQAPEQAAGAAPAAATFAATLQRFLFPGPDAEGSPILGLAPDRQRAWRELCTGLEAWREAAIRCGTLGNTALAEATLGWQREMIRLASPPDHDTLRDSWLHHLDEAQQSLLRQPRFIRALAKLEQHAADTRALAIQLLEPVWHEVGLSTRADLHGLIQRLQEQRSRDAGEIHALRDEIAALRAELREISARKDNAR